jgi:hypothetical protein
MTSPNKTEVMQLDTNQGGGRFWLALLLLTAMGAILRFYHLADPSMWIDELFTVRDAGRLAHGVVGVRPMAYVPFYLGMLLGGIDVANLPTDNMATWRGLSVDEYIIRLPAAIIGVATLLLLGWLSRRVLGWQVALICALLLAVAPWHLWGSQTARFYILQFLFYNASLLLYYDATRRNSRRMMAMSGLCIVLAFAAQLTSLVLVMVFLTDWVIAQARRQPIRWGWFGWLCIIGTTGICLGWYRWHTGDATHAVKNFVGSTHTVKDILLGTPFMVGFPVVTVALLSGWWLLRKQARLAILLAAGAILPILVIVGLKNFYGIDVHVRYCFITLYCWLALASLGLWQLFEQVRAYGKMLAWIPLAVVLVSMAWADYIYFQGAAGYRPRWREAYAYVQENRQQGQEVVGGDYIPRLVGNYYLKMDDQAIIGVTSQMREKDYARVADGKPMWIVVRGVSATGGDRFRWIDEHAELKAYFATQAFQPYASVHVYYYDLQGAGPVSRQDQTTVGQPRTDDGPVSSPGQ